jgi:Ala-tRNA(Pro) deacylase
MSQNKAQEICHYLDRQAIPYTLISHSETRTSEESSRVRAEQGFPDVTGAKAILMKLERKQGTAEFSVFVLPSHLKLNSKTLKQQFLDLKSLRFATVEELADLTGGLVPGSLPPFAKPIFSNLDSLFIDELLLACDPIAFNVASLSQSLILSCKDYIRVACPASIFTFSH